MHIAITGSIGSGKSLVSAYLKELGYPVLSADEEVHALYQREDVKQALVKQFGSPVLTCMNEVDTAYLKFRIFNFKREKRELEAWVHPLVYQALCDKAKRLSSKLVFSEVPLLFESKGQSYFDQSVLILCDQQHSFERLNLERKMSLEEIELILSQQMPIEEKRKLADFVIENKGSKEALKEKVIQYLHSLSL